MENLVIKNFGPIRDAKIDLKDINVFIGTTSSGKSTAAKLIAIFKSISLKPNINFSSFRKLLADYNINFAITNDTLLHYTYNDLGIKISDRTVFIEGQKKDQKDKVTPIYIPAERLFFSIISQSIFTLINNDISLPKWIIDFGAKFEQARNSIKTISIKFLNAEYSYEDNTDYIQLKNDTRIKLSEASSGLQSVIPLLLVVLYNTEKGKGEDIFVIEEPELNLYPSSQKDLIEFIIARINQAQNDKLIITTHSPYLLTTIDNLIQAQKVVDLIPDKKGEVEGLVNKDAWINFDRISCYYFDKGTCKSTLDLENQSIGPSNIDDVSINLSETFEKLLTLKYAHA
jgi:predicted ATPase